MKKLLFCALLIFTCSLLSAFDFELVLDQSAAYDRTGETNSFEYEGSLVPRFSGLLGENGNYAVSAGLSYEYGKAGNEQWNLIPELIEANFFFNFNNWNLNFGRMFYQAPLSFIVNGFFDGGLISFDTRAGIFSAGAWYTGFINKSRAMIKMTDEEYRDFYSVIEYNNDFVNTYFAPSRAFMALEWEHPSIARYLRLGVSLLGQFDFTNEELHSQYLIAKMTMPFGIFTLDLGGCFSLLQQSGEMKTALAAEMELGWYWQKQGLSFLARYSSGHADSMGAFLPITTTTQGNILYSALSGLTVFSIDYSLRLHQMLSFNLIPAYYIGNAGANSGVSGGEIFGRINFSPFSDIMFSLGGGMFIPSPENTAPYDNNVWRLELNLVIAIF